MNYKRRFFQMLLLLTISGSTPLLASDQDPWQNLNPSQQAAVKSGKQILINEEMPNDPWPCFHVYRITSATPTQVAAVFWDVAYDANYIPDCLKSTVNGHPAMNMVDATYEIKVPFLPNEISKVRSKVKTLSGDGYKIEWHVLASRYSKSSQGNVILVPYQKGTLIAYTNYVVPGSSIAGLLKGAAENQVQATVTAIAQQVESEVKSSPAQLADQIQQLKRALGLAEYSQIPKN